MFSRSDHLSCSFIRNGTVDSVVDVQGDHNFLPAGLLGQGHLYNTQDISKRQTVSKWQPQPHRPWYPSLRVWARVENFVSLLQSPLSKTLPDLGLLRVTDFIHCFVYQANYPIQTSQAFSPCEAMLLDGTLQVSWLLAAREGKMVGSLAGQLIRMSNRNMNLI